MSCEITKNENLFIDEIHNTSFNINDVEIIDDDKINKIIKKVKNKVSNEDEEEMEEEEENIENEKES